MTQKKGFCLSEKIKECSKQLKADLGIIPYSDVAQPEKFAEMSMSDVEENINDFIEVINSLNKEFIRRRIADFEELQKENYLDLNILGILEGLRAKMEKDAGEELLK